MKIKFSQSAIVQNNIGESVVVEVSEQEVLDLLLASYPPAANSPRRVQETWKEGNDGVDEYLYKEDPK